MTHFKVAGKNQPQRGRSKLSLNINDNSSQSFRQKQLSRSEYLKIFME